MERPILTYTVHLEPEPEGGFTVTVPALQGCVTYGRDYGHALEMAREAIEGFLEALVKAGQPLPPPEEPTPNIPTDIVLSINSPVPA